MNKSIAKSDWLTAEQCLKQAWLGLRTAPTPPTEAELFRMEQGQEVGALARKLYPEGVLVSSTDQRSPIDITRELISDTSILSLFEAKFRAGPLVAKADILTRQAGAWNVLEVKSSFSDTTRIEELVDDLAYTVMVVKRVGLQVATASLVLLSRNYRFGDGPGCLFDVRTVTGEVLKRVAEFEKDADSIVNGLLGDKAPKPALVSACRSCPFFADECLGAGVAHTIFEIPSLHHTKLKRLSADGIVDLSHVPNDLNLNARQERAKQAALSGKTVVEPGLDSVLASLTWPCHYLDFETVAPFLPLYKGHGCHRQVLTQFSIHHRDTLDTQVRHSEYLADPARDCERELAEALIEGLGTQGSVIVYGSFEATRIKALRDALPDLAVPLQTILDRLRDLSRIIEDYVYHPDFQGSFSIKKVLPALVPDLSYAALDVADGDTAITRFARMARGEIVGAAVEVTRGQLLEYCKLDTFAMVRLHEALAKLV